MPCRQVDAAVIKFIAKPFGKIKDENTVFEAPSHLPTFENIFPLALT
jgi:hypothetical protein